MLKKRPMHYSNHTWCCWRKIFPCTTRGIIPNFTKRLCMTDNTYRKSRRNTTMFLYIDTSQKSSKPLWKKSSSYSAPQLVKLKWIRLHVALNEPLTLRKGSTLAKWENWLTIKHLSSPLHMGVIVTLWRNGILLACVQWNGDVQKGFCCHCCLQFPEECPGLVYIAFTMK